MSSVCVVQQRLHEQLADSERIASKSTGSAEQQKALERGRLQGKREALAQVAETYCLEGQRGGLVGRTLTDNVIDIEGMAHLVCRAACAYPCMFFYDFSAAFPSIEWRYLFALLRRMKCSGRLIALLRALY